MQVMIGGKSKDSIQRALALAYAKPFCKEKGFSFEKLEKQRFIAMQESVIFAAPSNVKPDGLRNDIETQPIPTLLVKLKDGKIVCEATEHAEKHLK